MQVEIKKPSVIDFNKIEVGELFYYNESDGVFMKINEFEDIETNTHNAIRLNDGRFAYFSSMDRVSKANGKLVVTLV